MASEIDIIDFIVDIDVTAYGPPNFSDYGLHDGHFRWCYGDSFTPPGGAAKGGIMSGMDSMETSVDISETGGFFTESSFSCSIQNSLNFENLIAAYGIRFVGLPLVVSFYDGTNETTIWTGRVSAWSTGETEINISASVEALVPSGDLQNSVIDAYTYPNAPEDSLGLPVPAVFGDVEYSPMVTIQEAGKIETNSIPFDVEVESSDVDGTTTLSTNGFLAIGFYGVVWADFWVSFVSGPSFPSRSYRVLSVTWDGSSPGDNAHIVISGKIDGYVGHEFVLGEYIGEAWFYKLIYMPVSAVASRDEQYGYGVNTVADSTSKYISDTNQYVRKVGAATKKIGAENNEYLIRGGIRASDGINSLIFNTKQFSLYSTMLLQTDHLSEWIATEENHGYDKAYDTLHSTYAQYIIPALPADNKLFYLSLTNITKEYLPVSDGDIYICMDMSIPGHSVDLWYVDIYTTKGTLVNAYSYTVPGQIRMDDFNFVPNDFCTDTVPNPDNFEMLLDATNANLSFKIPSDIVNSLNQDSFDSISYKFSFTTTSATTSDLRIRAVCFAYNIGSDNPNNGNYLSTEGETVGNDGTTKTNSMHNAALHIVEDYAGSTATVPATGVGAIHVGRTITEPIKVQDALDSLLKQAFAVGYIGKTGVITVKGWLDSIGSSPVVAFNEDNIIRDSISQWTTTPTNRVYNSFSCAYDYDYETDKYRSSMAINNPSGTFPAITGAWDKFVSGIGSGSDATAYAEAAEAWEYCRAGFSESGALRAYSKSNGELSWFTDPSWLGTPVAKTDLSAWYFIKTCAYWLSTPRREAKFRVPLSYIGLNILDYCTFQDYIVTNDIVYSGWITSLSIDREGITVGMSMDRQTTETATIRERGLQTIADDTYTERGVQTIADDTISESGM